MSTPPLTRAAAEATIAAVQAALDAGYKLNGKPSAVHHVSNLMSIPAGTVWSRLRIIKRDFGMEPVEPPDAPADLPPIVETIQKPRVRVKVHSGSDAPIYRVLGIGDVHAKPGRTTDPVKWAGRHAAATKPDRIVAIGDWLSLDSCSTHPAKGSYRDHDRPSFSQDIEAGEESLDAFDKGCPGDQIPREITLGNHEHRAWTRADMDPKLADDFPIRVDQTFARYRWKTHPYGRMLYIAGCGFIHVPLTAVSKPYGGKHSENSIGNDATHSIIWGHDHRYRMKTVGKIGPNNRITLCNLGTCMPFGEIEDYSVGTTGWSYGVVDLRLQAGLIVSAKFIDVRELEELYGD